MIGTVGRIQAVKDQATLVRAFAVMMQARPEALLRVRLAIIGDGRIIGRIARSCSVVGNCKNGLACRAPSVTSPALLRTFDMFVLPSLSEGISNTILEAMASGLPVIATDVGGNPEIVEDGVTGTLVAPSKPSQLADAIRAYVCDPGKMVQHGRTGRKRAESEFSIESMVNGYMAVYDSVLFKRRPMTTDSRAEERQAQNRRRRTGEGLPTADALTRRELK